MLIVSVIVHCPRGIGLRFFSTNRREVPEKKPNLCQKNIVSQDYHRGIAVLESLMRLKGIVKKSSVETLFQNPNQIAISPLVITMERKSLLLLLRNTNVEIRVALQHSPGLTELGY
jgi:hypothetical protein